MTGYSNSKTHVPHWSQSGDGTSSSAQSLSSLTRNEIAEAQNCSHFSISFSPTSKAWSCAYTQEDQCCVRLVQVFSTSGGCMQHFSFTHCSGLKIHQQCASKDGAFKKASYPWALSLCVYVCVHVRVKAECRGLFPCHTLFFSSMASCVFHGSLFV